LKIPSTHDPAIALPVAHADVPRVSNQLSARRGSKSFSLFFYSEVIKMLKASPFLHILQMNDDYLALYHSLSLEIAFVEKQLFESCKSGNNFIAFDNESKSVLDSLVQIGLLIEKNSDGLELFNSYRATLEYPSINILYLLLTDACNLRCGYCYFLANMDKGYKFSFMKEETAIAAIDMFGRCIAKSDSKDQQIVIYGGEPLLNRQTLLTVLRYIDKAKEKQILPAHVSVTINTNGILLEDEIIEQAKESKAVIAISIDGPKEIHDKKRVYQSGKWSFDDVIKGYNLAKSAGARLGICITVDQHNIFQLEDVVRWTINELEAKGMGFNILIENSQNMTEDDYGKYSRLAAKKLIECFKIAREKGVYEDRIMRRVKCFVEKEPVLSDCGGCGLQIVISPDGKIGTCQAFCGSKEYFVSEPFETFEPEKHQFWKEWRSRSPLSMDECKNCIALGNCGGGCLYSAYKRHGTLWSLDDRFCVHAKTTVEFLIKDLWEKQNQ